MTEIKYTVERILTVGDLEDIFTKALDELL